MSEGKNNIAALDEQSCEMENKVWRVTRLIQLAASLEVMKIPLKHFNIYNQYPKSKTTMEFVDNMQKVLDADLKYPIILDDEGYVMDGRHRLCKALLEKREYILAVRFDKTPSPDRYKDEDEK
jgi:L-ribulose-5-phosphate 3-epimerase UlaE